MVGKRPEYCAPILRLRRFQSSRPRHCSGHRIFKPAPRLDATTTSPSHLHSTSSKERLRLSSTRLKSADAQRASYGQSTSCISVRTEQEPELKQARKKEEERRLKPPGARSWRREKGLKHKTRRSVRFLSLIPETSKVTYGMLR
jgi:hypothetical protein